MNDQNINDVTTLQCYSKAAEATGLMKTIYEGDVRIVWTKMSLDVEQLSPMELTSHLMNTIIRATQ